MYSFLLCRDRLTVPCEREVRGSAFWAYYMQTYLTIRDRAIGVHRVVVVHIAVIVDVTRVVSVAGVRRTNSKVQLSTFSFLIGLLPGTE